MQGETPWAALPEDLRPESSGSSRSALHRPGALVLAPSSPPLLPPHLLLHLLPSPIASSRGFPIVPPDLSARILTPATNFAPRQLPSLPLPPPASPPLPAPFFVPSPGLCSARRSVPSSRRGSSAPLSRRLLRHTLPAHRLPRYPSGPWPHPATPSASGLGPYHKALPHLPTCCCSCGLQSPGCCTAPCCNIGGQAHLPTCPPSHQAHPACSSWHSS